MLTFSPLVPHTVDMYQGFSMVTCRFASPREVRHSIFSGGLLAITE